MPVFWTHLLTSFCLFQNQEALDMEILKLYAQVTLWALTSSAPAWILMLKPSG